ncbi:MAG: hydroxyacid dehydrogenase [Armatimonadota bacterium]
MKPRVLALISAKQAKWFYPDGMRELLQSVADPTYLVYDEPLTSSQLAARIGEYDALFTDWGTPRLTQEVLDAARRLRVVCHAGGSVRFLLPDPPSAFFRRGIGLSSATPVMSRYVAEHTLSLAIAVLRRVPFYRDKMRGTSYWWDKGDCPHPSDTIIGQRVGMVGLGMISWEFVRLIKPFNCQLYAFSRHGDAERARGEGLTLTGLDELMSTCPIVCLFAAVRPDTIGMIDARRLKLMPDGGVLINAARGKLIDEPALVEELKTGRIWAGLDVTDPEPPEPESPLRVLPNVLLTPHVAGPTPTRYWEFVEYATRDMCRFLAGEPLAGEVTERRLEGMA